MSDDRPRAEDWLVAGGEAGAGANYDAPPGRPGSLVEPLIDGVATFQAMERAIDAATDSVLLSLWIFNPTTLVQAREVRTKGVRTWADLLRAAADRGATVRVLLTDFDPLFAASLHVAAWKAYGIVVKHAARLGAGARARLQVIVSRHPATLTTGVKSRLADRLAAEVTALNSTKKGVDTTRLAQRPGLWTLLSYDRKTRRVSVRRDAKLFATPTTHHQKTLVVDGAIGFCGGLDVNPGRIDTPAHTARSPWHDVHCRAEGPVVGDLSRNLVTRWNTEVPLFVAFRDAANRSGMPVALPVHPPTAGLPVPAAPAAAKGGRAVAQALRTVSEEDWTPIPENVVNDVEKAYRRAIGRAERFVYIENQYIRSPELGSWLVKRATEKKELQVILVLPVAPEEVAQKGGPDPVTLHGLALQHKLITTLKAALSTRLGVFSMVKRAPAETPHATDAFGSRQVYVHSKCLIVDDVYALVGSANANPRSFLLDTELCVGWVDPRGVPGLRRRLWAELLGAPAGLATWAVSDYVAKWTAIAQANEKVAPAKRAGFIVRHNVASFPGKRDPDIPNEFAGVFDPEVTDPSELLA